jgi:hypothetical protein
MNQSPPETLLTADTLPEMVSAKASPLFPNKIPIEADGFLRLADELKQQIDQIKQTLHPESDLWTIILQKLTGHITRTALKAQPSHAVRLCFFSPKA